MRYKNPQLLRSKVSELNGLEVSKSYCRGFSRNGKNYIFIEVAGSNVSFRSRALRVFKTALPKQKSFVNVSKYDTEKKEKKEIVTFLHYSN